MEFNMYVNTVVVGVGILMLLFLRFHFKHYVEAELRLNLRLLQSKLHENHDPSERRTQYLLKKFDEQIENWQDCADQRVRFMNLLFFSMLNRSSGFRPKSTFSIEFEKYIKEANDEEEKNKILKLRDNLDSYIFAYLLKTSFAFIFIVSSAVMGLIIRHLLRLQLDKLSSLRIMIKDARLRYFKGTIENADYEIELLKAASVVKC